MKATHISFLCLFQGRQDRTTVLIERAADFRRRLAVNGGEVISETPTTAAEVRRGVVQ